MTHEQPAQATPTQEEILLEAFLGLDTPEGLRTELIEGEIIVSLPTDGDHEDCIGVLIDQVIRSSSTRMQVSGYKGLRLPSGGRCPKNHAIPDATFAPLELRLFRGAPPWMDPDGVAMVVEVTSSKPLQDRIAKRHCYARAKIPLYLLIDRDESKVSVFGKPEGDEYTEVHLAPFGKPLALPEPFAFELDTAPFL
ncbi:Uma2 family endonuclease [Kitasatospora sp. MAP12-15]|uniref:Uma2 family endonuclease n=1 Tax=unclassified Kitasatospora TaxID=2633591 RepID=UPI0024732B14|nr:Uma2 family endonuclease [Kitasatospora sp. MAP12-44]MDH6113367.1 Uma2 family endonuclease [Kitasatospora sp. MAP12-44]